MGVYRTTAGITFWLLFVLSAPYTSVAFQADANQTVQLSVDTTVGRAMPDTLFGIFFEEINHAGAGGIWAELVSNRGFEAGGVSTPSNIDPWTIIGNESSIIAKTELSSCFDRNKVALRIEVLCDSENSSNICPTGGVGVYNPGYWGMNIEQGETYKVVLYIKSLKAVDLSVSFTSSDGQQELAARKIAGPSSTFLKWTKVELLLESKGNDSFGRLQFTTSRKGVIWLDQVSAIPMDTFKGHGFRKDLLTMVQDLKPRFIRFPGGCFVEGEWLRNAFRWRETIGPWEQRPGHFGDVWLYWTDDGLGYFELLQLAEDLGAVPIWVVNNGIGHRDQVATSNILPFVQDVLDSIEFARGAHDSKWGSVRASMGHSEPFNLSYVALGNEDCGKPYYRGNYLKFYHAIKDAYPDIKIISNCDGSSSLLDHPADLYDFHTYPNNANSMFSLSNKFDGTTRTTGGPKAFVSEYAVNGNDAGRGSFLAALAEAAFLIGLEHNSDVVEMTSYAPLFVNDNDRRWNPDAIVFNSWQRYGTPSYWMQHFFKESSGATLHNSTIVANSSIPLVSSAITWQSTVDDSYYLRIKVVNFGSNIVNLKISVSGLDPNAINSSGSRMISLTSTNLMDENSFSQPNKVVPVQAELPNAGVQMTVTLSPYSLNAFDLSLVPAIKPIYEPEASM